MTTSKKDKPQRQAKRAEPPSLISRMSGSISRMRTGADLAATRVRMVRSRFPGLNRAAVSGAHQLIGSAGWPMGTTAIVHGPNGSGKTSLLAELAIDFQIAGGEVLFIEPEETTQLPWFWRLGVDPNKLGYIGRYPIDERPSDKQVMRDLYYEDVVEWIKEAIAIYRQDWIAGIKRGPLLIVIDSLTKLMPKSVQVQIAKSGGNLRKATLGMTQAAFNTILCADVGVKIADWDIAIVFVCHETEKVDSGHRSFGSAGNTTKVKGGSGIQYDAALRLQTSFAGRVFDLAKAKSKDGDDDNKRDDRTVVGKKHRVRFEKSKIGPQAYGDHSSFEYFVSTGTGKAALGFDRPREIVNEALRRGVLESTTDGDGWSKRDLTLGSRFELNGKSFILKSLYDEDGLPTERVLEIASLLGVPR